MYEQVLLTSTTYRVTYYIPTIGEVLHSTSIVKTDGQQCHMHSHNLLCGKHTNI